MSEEMPYFLTFAECVAKLARCGTVPATAQNVGRFVDRDCGVFVQLGV